MAHGRFLLTEIERIRHNYAPLELTNSGGKYQYFVPWTLAAISVDEATVEALRERKPPKMRVEVWDAGY